MLLMGTMRSLLFFFRKKMLASGWGRKSALILGAGEMGKLLVRKLSKEQSIGYHVFGFLDDDPDKLGKVIGGVKVIGDLSLVKEMILINRF